MRMYAKSLCAIGAGIETKFTISEGGEVERDFDQFYWIKGCSERLMRFCVSTMAD